MSPKLIKRGAGARMGGISKFLNLKKSFDDAQRMREFEAEKIVAGHKSGMKKMETAHGYDMDTMAKQHEYKMRQTYPGLYRGEAEVPGGEPPTGPGVGQQLLSPEAVSSLRRVVEAGVGGEKTFARGMGREPMTDSPVFQDAIKRLKEEGKKRTAVKKPSKTIGGRYQKSPETPGYLVDTWTYELKKDLSYDTPKEIMELEIKMQNLNMTMQNYLLNQEKADEAKRYHDESIKIKRDTLDQKDKKQLYTETKDLLARITGDEKIAINLLGFEDQDPRLEKLGSDKLRSLQAVRNYIVGDAITPPSYEFVRRPGKMRFKPSPTFKAVLADFEARAKDYVSQVSLEQMEAAIRQGVYEYTDAKGRVKTTRLTRAQQSVMLERAGEIFVPMFLKSQVDRGR